LDSEVGFGPVAPQGDTAFTRTGPPGQGLQTERRVAPGEV
jgi:hypothetical protein